MALRGGNAANSGVRTLAIRQASVKRVFGRGAGRSSVGDLAPTPLVDSHACEPRADDDRTLDVVRVVAAWVWGIAIAAVSAAT